MKLLLLLAVVAVLWWLRRLAQVGQLARQMRQSANQKAATSRLAPRPMLRCMVCGTQVPADEALQDARGAYCCAEHQRQAAASPLSEVSEEGKA